MQIVRRMRSDQDPRAEIFELEIEMAERGFVFIGEHPAFDDEGRALEWTIERVYAEAGAN